MSKTDNQDRDAKAQEKGDDVWQPLQEPRKENLQSVSMRLVSAMQNIQDFLNKQAITDPQQGFLTQVNCLLAVAKATHHEDYKKACDAYKGRRVFSCSFDDGWKLMHVIDELAEEVKKYFDNDLCEDKKNLFSELQSFDLGLINVLDNNHLLLNPQNNVQLLRRIKDFFVSKKDDKTH